MGRLRLHTHNGLVACENSNGWRVYAQGTGQFLASLPEQVGVVSRFVRKVEQMMFWPMVQEIDTALRERLEAVAHEVVNGEINAQQANRFRLEA